LETCVKKQKIGRQDFLFDVGVNMPALLRKQKFMIAGDLNAGNHGVL